MLSFIEVIFVKLLLCAIIYNVMTTSVLVGEDAAKAEGNDGIHISIDYPQHGSIIQSKQLALNIDLSLGEGWASKAMREDPSSWVFCAALFGRNRFCTSILASDPIPSIEHLNEGSEYTVVAYCVHLKSGGPELQLGKTLSSFFVGANRTSEELQMEGNLLEIYHPPNTMWVMLPITPHVELSLGLDPVSQWILQDLGAWSLCTDMDGNQKFCLPIIGQKEIPTYDALEEGVIHSMVAYCLRKASNVSSELRLGETQSHFLVVRSTKENKLSCAFAPPPSLPICATTNVEGAQKNEGFDLALSNVEGQKLVQLSWSEGQSHDSIVGEMLKEWDRASSGGHSQIHNLAYFLDCGGFDDRYFEEICLEACLGAAMQAVEVGATQVASSIARARRDAKRNHFHPQIEKLTTLVSEHAPVNSTMFSARQTLPSLASLFNLSSVDAAGHTASHFFKNQERNSTIVLRDNREPGEIERDNQKLLQPRKSWVCAVGEEEDDIWSTQFFDLMGPVLGSVLGCDTPIPRFGEGDGAKFACARAPLEAEKGCVVISIGCAGEWSFERGVASGAPQCNVHTFDCTGSWEVPPDIASRVTFHQLCVAPRTNIEKGLVSWVDLLPMTGLGDNGILRPPALLKMDIEGAGQLGN